MFSTVNPQAVKNLYLKEAAHYTIERFQLNESPDAIVAEWKQMTQIFYDCEQRFFVRRKFVEYGDGIKSRAARAFYGGRNGNR